MPGSGRETLPDVPEGWKSLPDVQKLSEGPLGRAGGPIGCPGVVRRPSRLSRCGEMPSSMSLRPRGCTGVFGRPSRMSGSGREALSDVWEWLGGPPGSLGGPPECPEVVGSPSRMSGSSWETLPNVQECWKTLPDNCEASQMSESGRKSLPNVREWSRGPHGFSGVGVDPPKSP